MVVPYLNSKIIHGERMKKSHAQDSDNSDEENPQVNHIMIPELDLKSFDEEAEKWSFQTREDIKTVFGEVETVGTANGSESAQDVKDSAGHMIRCHTKEVEVFRPRQIRRVGVHINNPIPSTCAITTNQRSPMNRPLGGV